MKKNIILLLIIFFLTGCSVNYNIKINSDLSVVESAYITESEDFYKSFYKTTKANALNSVLNIYNDFLKEEKYDAKVIPEKGPLVEVEKEYKNIEDYLNTSLLFNDYFDKINYRKEEDKIIIETENFNKNDSENPDRFYAEKVDIAITPSFKVVDSNANKVDEDTNTYHFYLDDKMEDFKIYLVLNTSRKFYANMNTYMIILVSIMCIIISWIAVGLLNKKTKR